MKIKGWTLGLLVLFLFICISKYVTKKRLNESILKDSIEACETSTNQLFGKSVDSVKTCNCLIPIFYNSLKQDSSEAQKFNISGIRDLTSENKERFTKLYVKCISENILDSSGTVLIDSNVKAKFKIQLRDSLTKNKIHFDEYKLNRITNCLIEKFNNQITIVQYLSEGFSKDPKIQKEINDCLIKN